MLRAVVIEDSPTARELIANILDSDPEIQVVGMAVDGAEGVELVQELRPDVVTMDIEMPRMNGFLATKEIMLTAPTPTVIVSTSTRVADVENSFRTLQAGALALVAKPVGPDVPNFDRSARELIETVKTMAAVKLVRHVRRSSSRTVPTALAATNRTVPEIVAIAASTGGPVVLQQLLAQLPEGFSLPILAVQHIAKGFTDGFVSWLDSTLRLRVKVAEPDEPLEGGTVYVAPQDRHLEVSSRRRVRLSDDDPVGRFRPSATRLFDAVARTYRQSACAVILTGMGRDGVDGLRVVREVGGYIIAQDEESCVVFGMPGVAVQENLPDAVLAPESIARQLLDWNS